MKLRYKKYYTINGIEEHKCKLCGFIYDENRSLSTHLQFKHKDYTTQKYYDEFYKKENEGKCEVCGKPTKFFNLMKGYLKCCSKSCSHKTDHFRKSFSESITNKSEEEIISWRNGTRDKIRSQSSYNKCITDEEVKRRNKQSLQNLKEIVEKCNCTFLDYEYGNNNLIINRVLFQCNKCGNSYSRLRACLDRRNREKNYNLCPNCSPKNNSKPEKELADYIASIYKGNIRRNDRFILKGNELDIVLPNLKLAFEFDGIFWHMDSRFYKPSDINPKTNHSAQDIWNFDKEKIKKCADIGITLIRIKEYDWVCDNENVKNNINQILNEHISS